MNYCWTKTYEECCSDLNWATVHQRHLLLACCQGYKIINKLNCLQFDDYFCVLINLLPGLVDLHWIVQVPELTHIDILFLIFFINLPFLWNTIPFNIVDSTSYGAFKSKLKL